MDSMRVIAADAKSSILPRRPENCRDRALERKRGGAEHAHGFRVLQKNDGAKIGAFPIGSEFQIGGGIEDKTVFGGVSDFSDLREVANNTAVIERAAGVFSAFHVGV